MDNLFSTHPNAGNRVARLRGLAQEWGQPAGRLQSYESIFGAAPASRAPAAPFDSPWGAGRAKRRRGPWG